MAKMNMELKVINGQVNVKMNTDFDPQNNEILTEDRKAVVIYMMAIKTALDIIQERTEEKLEPETQEPHTPDWR